MTPWAERWATSDGYQKAMAMHAKRHGEFWERHHRSMAELDEQERNIERMLDGAGRTLKWTAIWWGVLLAIGVAAAIF